MAGTVGYEFLNDVCALFVDRAAEPAFTELWAQMSDDRRDFDAVALDAKIEQAQTTFGPEVERLTRVLGGGHHALELALASMPVYRTYVEPEPGSVAEQDREAIERARMPREVAQRLLLERQAPPEFVTRFQQTSPPVVAKGVEDTAFYRYGRLLALNDVGGDPGRFGITAREFHAANARARRAIPDGDADDQHARHQALGRRARPDRRPDLDPVRMGATRAPLAGGHRAAVRRLGRA